MPNIDYSEEDLEQLLSVSSLAEYVVQMYNLHGTCRLNVLEFKESMTCPRCVRFADGMLGEIDEHLGILKGYIDKLPADSSKSFILPQLFAKISSSSDQKATFIKNVSHYTKALHLIHDSSSSLGHGDTDLTRLVETYSAITRTKPRSKMRRRTKRRRTERSRTKRRRTKRRRTERSRTKRSRTKRSRTKKRRKKRNQLRATTHTRKR
jgi:hypothetical protein